MNLKEFSPIWFDPENPWRELFCRVVYDGKDYAVSAVDMGSYLRDKTKLGLTCTESDLLRWGWRPLPDIEYAKRHGFVLSDPDHSGEKDENK